MIVRARGIRFVAAITAFALSAVACSGDEGAQEATSSSSAPASVTPTPAGGPATAETTPVPTTDLQKLSPTRVAHTVPPYRPVWNADRDVAIFVDAAFRYVRGAAVNAKVLKPNDEVTYRLHTGPEAFVCNGLPRAAPAEYAPAQYCPTVGSIVVVAAALQRPTWVAPGRSEDDAFYHFVFALAQYLQRDNKHAGMAADAMACTTGEIVRAAVAMEPKRFVDTSKGFSDFYRHHSEQYDRALNSFAGQECTV